MCLALSRFFTTACVAASVSLAAMFFSGGANAQSASPSLQVRYPDGASVTCPLNVIESNFLFIISSSSLDTTPSAECLAIVKKIEQQQNISDLRVLLLQLQGRTREEYEKALADFLLVRIGMSPAKVAAIHIDIGPKFMEWSDQQIAEFLRREYDRTTALLKRINAAQRLYPPKHVTPPQYDEPIN